MEDPGHPTELADVHRYAAGQLNSRINDPLSDHDRQCLLLLLEKIGKTLRKEHELSDTTPLDRSLTLGSESQDLFFELVRLLGNPVS